MNKVRSGEKFEVMASTWNAFIDAANFTKMMRQNTRGGGVSSGLDVGIVNVQNATENQQYRFGALVIDNIAVPPETSEDEFTSCAPLYLCIQATESNKDKPFVVLLEPLAPGATGRGMLIGTTPAQVNVLDETHGYIEPSTDSGSSGALQSSETGFGRILWKESGTGTKWALVQLGCGGAGGGGQDSYLCKVESYESSDGYEVTVYPSYDIEGPSLGRARLFVPDIALGAVIPQGTLIIGHKCVLKATGGSE